MVKVVVVVEVDEFFVLGQPNDLKMASKLNTAKK